MRTRWKVLSSILAMVMIIISFSCVVAADTEIIKQGTFEGRNYYEYKLFANGDLNVIYSGDGDVNLAVLGSDILCETTSVEVDFSNYTSTRNISIDGAGNSFKSLSVVSSKEISVNYFTLVNFSELENIVFSENFKFKSIELESLGITSLDFLMNYELLYIYIRDCNNLTEISVPSSLEDLSVKRCHNLTRVIIPESMTHLAFSGCEKLTDVNIPNDLVYFHWGDCSVSEITVPASKRFTVRSDVLEKATLADGWETINGGMFLNCSALSNVSVPNSVTTVMYSAFYGCSSLKSINLPSSVKDIGTETFHGSGLESFTIPSSVINIEYKVFADCKNLKSITIPTSIECVDASAFVGCTALKDVYYQGTEAQWNQIMFDPEDVSVSKIFNNATIHFNVKSGWSKSGDTWYYYDETGSLAKGWKQIKGEWYYFDTAGKMLTGWQKINNNWYYIGDDGVMASGWNQINGKWYFLGSGGAMKTGWYYTGSSWVYLNDDGDMAIGWKLINSKWYYFDTYGEMTTGWKSIGGKWYYFTDNGDMKTGWVEDDGDWYYMKSDGSMARSEYCGGYWLNSAGIWSYKYKANWYKNDNGWWYGDDSGWYAKNETLIIDGVSYDFDSNGYL